MANSQNVIEVPNYTQVPNFILGNPYGENDEVGLLPKLDGADLKVLLIIVRVTIGWHKKAARISVRRMARLTGMSTSTVQKAVKKLLDMKLVTVRKGKGVNNYGLMLYKDGVAITDTDVSISDTPSNKETGKEKEQEIYLLSLPKANWKERLSKYYPSTLVDLLAEFATLFNVNIPLFKDTSQRTQIVRAYAFIKACEGKEPIDVLRLVRKRYVGDGAGFSVSNLGSLANYATSILAKDRDKSWGKKDNKTTGGW